MKSLRVVMAMAVAFMLTFSCVGMNTLSKKPAGVETSAGIVAGVTKSDGLTIFKGIPYGRPPKGNLRFAPPRGAEPWKGVFHATGFGSSCPQLPDPGEAASKLPQSEDCLSLNIWTPRVDSKKRPVIVYFHGGAFNCGGSADPAYDGSAIARKGGIVFASINYRVGAFGFLNLEDFGADFAGSVNLGIQDQVLGLKWIKKNIAHFGGDPDNVTIMGESAGSVSVSILMTLPQAKGLFHKAIAESGVGVNLRTKEQSARETARVLEIAGVRDAAALRELPTGHILKAVQQAKISFVPVQDGTIIPVDPLTSIAAGAAAGIPLLTGTNKDEFRYWITIWEGLKTATVEEMVEGFPYFKIDLDRKKRTIVEHYARTLEDPTSNNIGFALIKDLLFVIPHLDLSDKQSKHADVWMYRFDWRSRTRDYLGACHAIELPFVFNNFDSPTSRELVGPHPPMGLANAMTDAWIAFAREGNPNHAGLVEWPVYEVNHRSTMIFNERSRVLDDPDMNAWFLYENISPKQAHRSGEAKPLSNVLSTQDDE